jgi:uncharacterized protein YggE
VTSVRDTEVPEPLDGIIGTMHECAGLGTSLSLDIADRFLDEAYQAGRKAAFIAAVEECEAYAAGLQRRIDAVAKEERAAGRLPSMPMGLAGDIAVAKQIAVRITQRAKR